MPVIASYQARCDQCGYLRRQYGETAHEAVVNALKAGWSAYPLLCPVCAGIVKARLKREAADVEALHDGTPAEGDGALRPAREGAQCPGGGG